MKKETNAQIEQRIRNISQYNPEYKKIVDLYDNEDISFLELCFEYKKIYAENWRKNVLSLDEWK